MKLPRLQLLLICTVLPAFYQAVWAQDIPGTGGVDSLRISKPDIDIPDLPSKSFDKPELPSTDSLRSAWRKPKIKVNGTVSAEYKYGVVPFMPDAEHPTGYVRIQGSSQVSAGNIPLSVAFQYTSLKTNYGLNNYFRVAFDAQKFQKNRLEQTKGKLDQLQQQKGQLLKQQEQLEQKLAYKKYMQQMKVPGVDGADSLLPGMPAIPDVPDLDYSRYLQMPDTSWLRDSLMMLDSGYSDSAYALRRKALQEKQQAMAMVNMARQRAAQADSLKQEIAGMEQQLRSVQQQISEISLKEDEIRHARDRFKPGKLGKNPFSPLTLRKLEIGLCYPNYGTFLINGTPLMGANVELQPGKFYIAAVHGKTLNNQLAPVPAGQGQWQNPLQKFQGFFDFNDLRYSRRITSVMAGIGSKDGDHLHIGYLYGVGSVMPADTSMEMPSEQAVPVETNHAVEINGRLSLSDNHILEMAYGRSSLQQQQARQTGISSFFSSNRSNAALLRYTGAFPKSRTKLMLSTRLIDPFFKSFGSSFMRSDNLRYEGKLEQGLGRKILLGAFFRRDQDNLLALYNYSTVIQTLGVTANIKPSKRLSLQLSYNPASQVSTSRNTALEATSSRNQMGTAFISYTPKARRISTTISGNYSYYHFISSGMVTEIQNATLSHFMGFEIPLQVNNTASWFYSHSADSLPVNTLVIESAYSYLLGKTTLGLTARTACNQGKWEYGYLVMASRPIYKQLQGQVQAERLLTGTYYASFDPELLRQFPYCISIKCMYNW